MASFSVKGPFTVSAPKLNAGRHLSAAEGKKFWVSHSTLAKERGCYVFAFRAAKGFKPIYVGKATKVFAKEVFTDHKLNKYNRALASQKKGTPVLFFVCLAKTKGAVNRVAIDEAESFLIQSGLTANNKLLNSRKAKVVSWSIKGVVRSGVGKPSQAATDFCQCLKI
jgi:hypothetical protein